MMEVGTERASTRGQVDLREFEGLPLSQSSSPCSSQTTTTTTATAPGAAGGTPPPRESLSITGTPTILVPASPDSRGDHLDPLSRYAIEDGHVGGCAGAKRPRRQHTPKLRLIDAKDDDVFQQDTKKPHKKAKVEHQVRPCLLPRVWPS
jgi:hypothetical protein